MADARAFDPFPTLTSALPRTDAGPRAPLAPRERRLALRAFKHDLAELRRKSATEERRSRLEERHKRRRYRSLASTLKERDRELGRRLEDTRRTRRRARTVFDAVAFERMYADGICEVESGLFSETVEFQDVSYQSATEERQKAVFSAMASLIDHFGSDTMVQYSVTNTELTDAELRHRRFFDEGAAGENAELARAFNEILGEKVADGCSNIVRRRTITYATCAPDAERAALLLSRMRASVSGQLLAAGASARVLDGRERLRDLSAILRPGKPFDFDYDRDLSLHSPLVAKDFVCPCSLDFSPAGETSLYRAEDVWCQVLVVRPNLAAEISDRAVSNICDLPYPLTVTWHLQPIDKAKSVALVRRQASWLQKEVIDNQRRALRQGFDTSILPPELSDTRAENELVLDQILHANQRLYYFCGLVFTWARTRDELEARVVEICRTAHAEGIELATLDLRQREGMNSVLALAHNHTDVVRDLTTTEACVFMPFTTQELDMAGGGYYGLNRLSGNLVVCDRKRLMSPHGFVCGMSGSGKSFSVKREIVNTILSHPQDEVYVMDVTGEYSYLVRRCHGRIVELGPDSRSHMNPLEMAQCAHLSRQAALAWKVDALLAMCAALKSEGGADLTQEERSVIAASAETTYVEAKDSAPTLADFVANLAARRGAGEAEASGMALVLSRYVTGPLSFLSHPTDVTMTDAQLTSFETSQVPADMRVFCMLANLESVRMRMLANHERGISTWLYIDEVQSLFAHPAIISYLARLWREGRKYGLICTGMTQSASAMSQGGEAASIVDQSGFLLLLRQADADRAFWARSRSLSSQEEGYISETCQRGQGLLIADAARVPVADDFPKDNVLFDMFSTSPEDYARQRELTQSLDAEREEASS